MGAFDFGYYCLNLIALAYEALIAAICIIIGFLLFILQAILNGTAVEKLPGTIVSNVEYETVDIYYDYSGMIVARDYIKDNGDVINVTDLDIQRNIHYNGGAFVVLHYIYTFRFLRIV